MKFVRLLLIWLGVLLALVAILVAVAFTSPLQTWLAQTLLDRQPGWKSSIGEVSAGFGRIKLTDLHVEANGAVLTLPSLEAQLPLSKAVRERSVSVRSLVAKGWTLDLSGVGEAQEEPAPPGSAPNAGEPSGTPAQAQAVDTAVKRAEQIFHGILGGWKSPYDLALDGVDLEGDVLVSVSPEHAPVRVHVVLKGGGLSGGHEGDFALEAGAADSWRDVSSVAVRGHILVGMSSPRALDRVEITADLTAQGPRFPADFAVSVKLKANHRAGETAVSFDLTREHRHIAVVQARISPADQRVVGNWQVDAHDADLSPFALQTPLPAVAVAGEGRFDADRAFSEVHVIGRLDAATNHLETLAPRLAQLGPLTIATRFEVVSRGRTLHVETLEASLAGRRPVAVVHALQAFDFNGDTHELQPADPAGDWLEASVQALPLNWLSGFTGKFAVTGGDATGDFVVQAGKGGYALRSKTPLVAKDATVERAGRTLGRDLDLELTLSAASSPEGWQITGSPLTVSSAGHRLATLTAAVARAGADKPATLTGTWTADLDAMAGQPGLAGFARALPRSASGEFNATVDSDVEVDSKLSVLGHDPALLLTATVHAESAGEGTIAFKVPITLSVGKNVSVFSAEGSWSGGDAGVRLSGRLTGEDVDLDHVRRLATPLAVALGFPRSLSVVADTREPATPAAAPDGKPFWQGWSGEVTVAFDRLRSGGKAFNNVGATFDIDESSIRLARGWFGPTTDSPTQTEGSLTFDGSAEFPYRLKATVTVNDIDAGPLLGASPKKDARQQEYKYGDEHEQEPVLEGHFSLAATLTGNGRNPDELLRRAQEEYHVTGKSGIIRLLKTSIADALPGEPPTPVGDAASTVGGWVGWLAGVKKDSLGSDEKKVGKNTEAVLNLTSQIAEIGYDQLSVTAIRGHDDVIRLVTIELTARDERLTGSGQIAAGSGQPLASRPLSMDLKLGVRGNVAGLLTQAGLLTKQNDELGYLQLVRPAPLHFGGTLQNPDATDWHDLLAKAAMPPVPAKPGKK